MVIMEFQKVTISLPKGLYERGMQMVKEGFFSSISDLVRSGIREELKDMDPVMDNWEKELYSDNKLIKSLKQSEKDYKNGKVTRFKNIEEMNKFLEEL